MIKTCIMVSFIFISTWISSDTENLFEKDQATSGKRLEIVDSIEKFYNKNKKLPKDLNTLKLKQEKFFQYVMHHKRKFSICTQFHTNYLEIMSTISQRGSCWMTAPWYHFKKGTHCLQYRVRKNLTLQFVKEYLIS